MNRLSASRSFWLLLAILLTSPVYANHGGEGLKVQSKEIATGTGAEAEMHAKVKVHYNGWLIDGTKFDSSVDRGEPFEFQLGVGQVIPGWDLGVDGMKVGGKRELIIPPELGYGARGAGELVPANAALRFEIELLEVTPPTYANIGNGELRNKLVKGIKLFDIRRPEEWKQTGVVAGSIAITAFDNQGRFQKQFLDELAKQVGKDEEFAIICRTGNRTAALANWLSTRGGYAQVQNVKNGITHWIDAGLPVRKN